MKVKCIDNRGCVKLTLNKEYEVIENYDEHYRISEDSGHHFSYFKDRFEIVKENNMELTIEQKVENLENQIKELKDQLKDQELVENNRKVWWIPKNGEKYWYINSYGCIIEVVHIEDKIDSYNISIGNCFKTKEEAERELFEKQLRFKLKKFAYENNNKEIDWNNFDQDKYYIYYSHNNRKLDYDYAYSMEEQGTVIFNSKEIVEKAIEVFKDDLIRYFTSDK